jgi:hypothetical protein
MATKGSEKGKGQGPSWGSYRGWKQRRDTVLAAMGHGMPLAFLELQAVTAPQTPLHGPISHKAMVRIP